MSRPKKMLPVLGQTSAPKPEAPGAVLIEEGGCTDDCCGGDAEPALVNATPTTREANPEALGVAFADDGFGKTVLRIEGMDCASCAATVEKRVFALSGVRRATVNFAVGRLDAEHDPGLPVEEIEKAVEGAGYHVVRTEGAEGAPFWRTRRAALTGASALLFVIGLVLSLAGASGVLATGAYVTAVVVGGLPIFRAAVAGLRARRLDMNVLMSAATIGAAGIGEWAEAASVVVLFSAGNALQA